MLRWNPSLNRIEFINLDNEVVGVWPPEAITEQERSEGVEAFPMDDATRAAFERYRAGDAAAGETLAQSLRAANQQAASVVRDSLTRGQDNTAPLTARPGEKVGVLQTPAQLNANLNVAETALNTEDAFQKLAIEEAGVVAAAREAGLGDLFTPAYFQGRYGDIQNGMSGPFPADPQAIQTRLNSAQANDPDYINYINRIGGITAAAEINRRQNILADARQKIQGAGAQKERNRTSDDLARQLSEMDEDFQLASEAILAKGGVNGDDAQRALDRLYRETTVKKERLENALWRAMADADPARAVAYFAAREQPQGDNAITGRAPGPLASAPSSSKGPPTEGINLAAAYGTRDRFGNLTYPGRENGIFAAPGTGTPPAPTTPAPAQPEKPSTPPPPGKDYFFENGRWVLKDITEYQPETPAFAEGGYDVGGGGGAGYPDLDAATAPPPLAGEAPAPAAPPPPAAAAPAPGEPEAPEGGDPGSDAPLDEEPLPVQPVSGEEAQIAAQIAAIHQKARMDLQEFNMARQRLAQQAQLLRQSEQSRIVEAQSRATDAGAQFQARLLQLDAQMREAIAQNPFAARQLRAIVRPDIGGARGPLQTPGGRFDQFRQNVNQPAMAG